MKFLEHYRLLQERVYHGTPNTISDKFDLKFIGQGSGVQAHGWGLYFAEDRGIADSYRSSAYQKSGPTDDGKWVVHRARQDDVPFDTNDEADDYIRTQTALGNVYTVDIDCSEIQLLDWHRPLRKQTNYVKEKLEPLRAFIAKGINNIGSFEDLNDESGGRLYIGLKESFSMLERFGGLERSKWDVGSKYKSASKMLLAHGIKGIVYKDNSTGNGSNFVIFDDTIVTIENRDK